MTDALVAGGTGLVGRELLAGLLYDGDFDRIHVLGRRSTGIADPKIVEHTADFDDLAAVAGDIGGVSHAFCALGTTIRAAGSKRAFRHVDHDFVIAFAEFARQRGARCFLFVSSLGADHDSGNFYLRTKGETERELQASGFDSLTILRPSLLIGDREEFRAGERASQLVLGLISPLLVGGLGRIRPVGAAQVAGAMRRLARSDERGIRIVESDEIRRIADPSS